MTHSVAKKLARTLDEIATLGEAVKHYRQTLEHHLSQHRDMGEHVLRAPVEILDHWSRRIDLCKGWESFLLDEIAEIRVNGHTPAMPAVPDEPKSKKKVAARMDHAGTKDTK